MPARAPPPWRWWRRTVCVCGCGVCVSTTVTIHETKQHKHKHQPTCEATRVFSSVHWSSVYHTPPSFAEGLYTCNWCTDQREKRVSGVISGAIYGVGGCGAWVCMHTSDRRIRVRSNPSRSTTHHGRIEPHPVNSTTPFQYTLYRTVGGGTAPQMLVLLGESLS